MVKQARELLERIDQPASPADAAAALRELESIFALKDSMVRGG